MILEVAEAPGTFRAFSETLTADDILEAARGIMDSRYAKGACFVGPDTGRNFFKFKLGDKNCEVFAVAFLDNALRLLAYEEMFRGSIDGAAVYIREIAKRALFHNARHVVLAHNHPSGCCKPSESDVVTTLRVRDALAVFEVAVIDHFVVGKAWYSMAENRDI